MIIAVVAGLLLLAWCVGNLIGWSYCRHDTRRNPVPWWNVPEPFNWRVFLGPKVYYDWYEAKYY